MPEKPDAFDDAMAEILGIASPATPPPIAVPTKPPPRSQSQPAKQPLPEPAADPQREFLAFLSRNRYYVAIWATFILVFFSAPFVLIGRGKRPTPTVATPPPVRLDNDSPPQKPRKRLTEDEFRDELRFDIILSDPNLRREAKRNYRNFVLGGGVVLGSGENAVTWKVTRTELGPLWFDVNGNYVTTESFRVAAEQLDRYMRRYYPGLATAGKQLLVDVEGAWRADANRTVDPAKFPAVTRNWYFDDRDPTYFEYRSSASREVGKNGVTVTLLSRPPDPTSPGLPGASVMVSFGIHEAPTE